MSSLLDNISIALAVVSLIVSILLVREAREKILKTGHSARAVLLELWSRRLVHFTVFLILETLALLILVRLHILAVNTLIALVVVSVFLLSAVAVSLGHSSNTLEKVSQKLDALAAQSGGLAAAMEARTKPITDRWPLFLDSIGRKTSLIALQGLLEASTIYDFNGLVIVLKIPRALEPTYRILSDRLDELRPVLEEIYGEPYCLQIISKD